MKKLFSTFISILVLLVLTACDQPTNTSKDTTENTPKVYAVGDTINMGGVQVTLTSFTKLTTNILDLKVTLKNTTSESVEYSSIWSWGALAAADGTQLETVTYIDKDIYFTGNYILPGITITDEITFTKYYGTSTDFVFYATPPLDTGIDFTANLTLE